MINKMQKEYLQSRLCDIKRKILEKQDISKPRRIKNEELYRLLKDKKYKLKNKDMIKFSNYQLYIDDILDLSDYKDEIEKNKQDYEILEYKLSNKIFEIMDNVMFSGLSIDDAIKEFINIEV